MALKTSEIEASAKQMLKYMGAERGRLDKIRAYVRGDPELMWLPTQGVPEEIRALAKLSRVNMTRLVVDSVVQSLYVDGYTRQNTNQAKAIWDIWQRNQADAKQIGCHRAAVNYGAAYGVGLPGEPVPVMRFASPRNLTAAYGEDDVWPELGLEKRPMGQWRLYDDRNVHLLRIGSSGFVHQRTMSHGADVCPIVRYLPTEDLDDPVVGEVEPLFALQDQINLTTFLLLVAQHYGAHGQRYIIGWLAKSNDEKLKVSASRLMTIPKKPGEVEVGEFDQVDLGPYIDSREATLRHLAVISQTPANELLGQIVQVSAEALDAVNASNARKLVERQTTLGEGHEQLLGLVGDHAGVTQDPLAEVTWKDTEARRLRVVVEALATLAEKLGVPVEELYPMVPGVSQSTVGRWVAARDGDPDAAREAVEGAPQEDEATDEDEQLALEAA